MSAKMANRYVAPMNNLIYSLFKKKKKIRRNVSVQNEAKYKTAAVFSTVPEVTFELKNLH